MKLHHHIATAKDVKARTERDLTDIYQTFKKPDLYVGLTRSYQPKNEDGDPKPPEHKPVQKIAADQINEIARIVAEQVSLQATIDEANTRARADIVVDGVTIALNVPATTLLALENRLRGVIEVINDAPVLSDGTDWVADQTPGKYRAPAEQTYATAKLPFRFEKAPATDKHPAQVEILYRDEPVGTWTTVKQAGALPPARRKEMLRRAQKLADAVKEARERANEVGIVSNDLGMTLSGWIFGQ